MVGLATLAKVATHETLDNLEDRSSRPLRASRDLRSYCEASLRTVSAVARSPSFFGSDGT